jgi:Na+-translocating ferredoxin:NAD+ oxidoreductase subunit G
MKDIIKIAINLTVVCVAAALILGVVFAKTDHARKETEAKMENQVRMRLLGFGEGEKEPEGLTVYSVYRYVITEGDKTTLGYIVPLKDGKFSLVQIDVEGNAEKVTPLNVDAMKLAEQGTRDAVVKEALKGAKAVFADTLFVANQNGQRLGYVAPGVTQGFKTAVRFMIGLDPNFTVKGVEVTSSEEDPGLGDDIKKDFFRNQFIGKTLAVLGSLDVEKKPLPDEYKTALEPELVKKEGWPEQKVDEIRKQHLKDNIYALTGATISSRALTNGVKATVRKFEYRYNILTQALKSRDVQAAF